MKKIYLLNSPVLTNEGVYKMESIDINEAKEAVKGNIVVSFIGHQATADFLSALLEINVPLNRSMFSQEVGDIVYVIKLNTRLPEGKILDIREMKQVDYKLYKLTRIA